MDNCCIRLNITLAGGYVVYAKGLTTKFGEINIMILILFVNSIMSLFVQGTLTFSWVRGFNRGFVD